MFSGLRVEINGDPAIGFPRQPHDDVFITKTTTMVIVSVSGSISVAWDGYTWVNVAAPDDLKEAMCGICGDANGDASNDWTIGDSDLCMDAFPSAVPG